MQQRAKLVYPELSYEIVGLLFEVHNELGPGHKEKIYERALCEALDEKKVKYESQVYHPVKFKGKIVGKYFLDILVEDKIVLEIKQGNRFSKKNIDQVLNYLKAGNLKLGIIAQFGTDEVKFKRILNIEN